MKLNEIPRLLSIDVGAPTPTVISNDNDLYLMFYSNDENITEILRERNSVYDKGIYIIKFNLSLKYKFGMPSNETISGHPYYKLGLRSYSFYQLEDSDWIKELKKIDSIHPYHNKKKWVTYKHYILTFHDCMFECIAKDFEISEEATSIFKHAPIILNEINANML